MKDKKSATSSCGQNIWTQLTPNWSTVNCKECLKHIPNDAKKQILFNELDKLKVKAVILLASLKYIK